MKPDEMSQHTSVTQVMAALKRHGGLLSPAAAELGIARQSLHERVAKSNELRAYLREIEDGVLDSVESIVIKAIEQGDMKTEQWTKEISARFRKEFGKDSVSADQFKL